MHAFTAAIQVPILPARTKSRSRTANKTTAPSTVDYHQSTTYLTNRWCHHYPNTINQPKYPNTVMAVHDIWMDAERAPVSHIFILTESQRRTKTLPTIGVRIQCTSQAHNWVILQVKSSWHSIILENTCARFHSGNSSPNPSRANQIPLPHS